MLNASKALSCLIFKKKNNKTLWVSTMSVTTSLIRHLRHRCWTHTEALETGLEHRQRVLGVCAHNLSTCLLLSLSSLTAMIPAVLSRNLYNKFVSQAKVAVNPFEATGSLRGSSSIRPPSWWVLIESGALMLMWVVPWNSPLSVHLSHLSRPNHVISSTSLSVFQA